MNSEEKPSTLTIKVIVRHSKACRKSSPGLTLESTECNCRKSLWIYENGEDKYISARTRSWEEAEEFAQAERDRRNPDKQQVKELKEQLAQKKADEAAKTLSIKEATDRWFDAQKVRKDGTKTVYQSIMKRIVAWADDNNILTVADPNPDNLDKWRAEWSPVAEKPYNRMAPATQIHFRCYLRSIFEYIVDLECYITKNPAAKLKPIKGSSARTKPLTQSQFQHLMAAIAQFCDAQKGILHEFVAEFTALFLLMRWTGLRIGDAIALPKCALVGNRLTLTTQKTGAKIIDRILPDDIVNALLALSEDRPLFKNGYFFWRNGQWRKLKSVAGEWEGYIRRLSDVLQFKDELGEPMRFRSHMLRDTFAVELLLLGTPIEQVAEHLTHADVGTTLQYYAAWVKARLEKMEVDLLYAYRSAGLVVSTGADLEPARQVDAVIAEFVAGLARTGRILAEESQAVSQIVGRLFASNHSANWKQLETNPGRELRAPGPAVQATFEVAPGAWIGGWSSGTRTQGAQRCEF